MTDTDIFTTHRDAWQAKPALRRYYQREIFDRIGGEMRPGPTLEIGTGAGFFADYRPGMTGIDVTPVHPSAIPGDVHQMPFDDGAFALRLLDEEHALVVPGSSFNLPSSRHFRITLLPEAAEIADVFARIERVLARMEEEQPESKVA